MPNKENPTWLNFGDVVKIVKAGHPMNGRVGSVAAPLRHASAIKLQPDEYWIELISNDGDKFYGRYKRDELEKFYA